MSTEEARRRICGLRTLRRISQEQMSVRGHEDWGLKRQELSRTERGDLPLTRVRKVALCGILDVHPAWFDEEDLSRLLQAGPSPRAGG